MIMKPSFEADMFVSQSNLNAKKLGYFRKPTGVRVALSIATALNRNFERAFALVSFIWLPM